MAHSLMVTKSNGPFCKRSDVEAFCSAAFSCLIYWIWAVLHSSWVQALVLKSAEPGPVLLSLSSLGSFKGGLQKVVAIAGGAGRLL